MDGQTDGQMICRSNTALWVASRRKNDLSLSLSLLSESAVARTWVTTIEVVSSGDKRMR